MGEPGGETTLASNSHPGWSSSSFCEVSNGSLAFLKFTFVFIILSSKFFFTLKLFIFEFLPVYLKFLKTFF